VTIHVGTCGWQYRDWRGRFYPEKLPQRDWLQHYSARFQTVEVDNTFYRLPAAEVFATWREHTPPDFCMALKTSRFLTHIRRLRDPQAPVQLFMERAGKLGDKLGPLLIQLPPTFKADPSRLADALDCFPDGVRLAFEPRHDSWFSEQTRQVLSDRNVAWCLTDSEGAPTSPVWRTAGWTYLRFHEGTGTPHPCYQPHTLREWAERLAEAWGQHATAFVYFNNDHRGCAVRDARVFAEAARAAGLRPTRVPEATETPVSVYEDSA
jgi:uncharacterized protein YecE (DUF72 family)